MTLKALREIVFLLLIIFIVCSCATIYNSRLENITITTREPSRIVIKNDTSISYMTQQVLSVPRSKEPVKISVINQTSTKEINVKSRNSFAFWLNLYPASAWTGFLIDMNNPKRYSYPRTIYIDTRSKENNYQTYKPLDSTITKFNNLIKFTPLKLIGFSNSGIEFSFERKTGNYFASQIIFSYLLPANWTDSGKDYKPNIKGYNIGIEEKYYFNKPAPFGPYVGLELSYLKSQYRDIEGFSVKNSISDTTYNPINYSDSIRIHKQTLSINLKLGYQYVIKRFSIDFYVGLGVRYKNVIDLDRINPNDEMERAIDLNINNITNRTGKYWTVSIPLNIRIGWIF
jgi:hypothetical protein